MQSQSSWLRLMAVSGLVCVFLFTACESDADRIREINEAGRTQATSGAPTATPTPLSAEIDLVDIQDGDCIDSTIEEGVTIESVVIVPCSGSWQYRVVNSFTVDNSNDYPGEDFFARLAIERCDRRYTDFLYPLRESWESFWGLLAHREVDCLQQSFGLSAVDPQRLDRLVGLERLNAGACYNDAPETGGLLVELVDCSGGWELQIVDVFSVPANDAFPRDAYFHDQAEQNCPTPWDYFYSPTSQSWVLGDREVICVRTP